MQSPKIAQLHRLNPACCLCCPCSGSMSQTAQTKPWMVRAGQTLGNTLLSQRAFENTEAWIWVAVPFMIGAILVLDIAIVLCLTLLDCGSCATFPHLSLGHLICQLLLPTAACQLGSQCACPSHLMPHGISQVAHACVASAQLSIADLTLIVLPSHAAHGATLVQFSSVATHS